MDSTVLLHYVRLRLGVARVSALSFCYGQRHARELEMAAWQAEAAGAADHHVIDISFFANLTAGATTLTVAGGAVPELSALAESEKDQPSTYVPNRNMMLLSLAAARAESVGAAAVYYGAQAQDEYGYWDCTVDFVARINDVLALNRRQPVRVHAPFATMRKAEIVRMGGELGVDFGHTWTCYRGESQPCGACPSCVERAGAFAEAGVDDALVGRR